MENQNCVNTAFRDSNIFEAQPCHAVNHGVCMAYALDFIDV